MRVGVPLPAGRPRPVPAALTLVLAAALGAGLLPGPASPAAWAAGDDASSRKAQVDRRVAQLREELEGTSDRLVRSFAELEQTRAELATAQQAQAAAEQALLAAQQRDAEVGTRLAAARQLENKVTGDLARSGRDIEDSRRAMGRLARSAYQNGGLPSTAGAMLEGAGPGDVTGRLELVDIVARSQRRTLSALAQRQAVQRSNQVRLTAVRAQVADLKRESEAAVAAGDEARRKAQERKDELAGLTAHREEVVGQVQAQEADERRRLDEAQAESDRLLAEIAAEQQRERDRAAAAQRSAQARRAPAPAPGGGAAGGSSGNGVFSAPEAGYSISSPFGWRIHPIFGTRRLHTGTDFAVPCGTPVRAAAAGTVSSAGPAGGYGNRLVISHGIVGGAAVSTTYNHLTRIVASGQVSRGQVVAYSGTTGNSTGCHLHFEVVRNGAYVDPMGYL